MLFAVGYDRRAGQSIHEVYVGGLARAIAALPDSVERFLYISSTGVYGHVTGSEVDEDSPCQPTREGGRACLAAEGPAAREPVGGQVDHPAAGGHLWPRPHSALAGPAGRQADRCARQRLAEPDPRRGRRADRAAGRRARGQPPQLYVVSDGQPVLRGDYYRELARLVGAPPPQFVEPRRILPPPSARRATSASIPGGCLRSCGRRCCIPATAKG